MVLAALAGPLQVKPWVYDPDKTGSVHSAWVPKIGLADAGNSNHALALDKQATTATNASSGATINFTGSLNELGFDIRDDSHCGAGAPRFNVYTASGTYYFFGCAYGTETPGPAAGWTRVRFNFVDGNLGGDAFAANGPFNDDDFDNVVGIEIVFDEGTDVGPGYAVLDNIDINGTLIGKPGNGK
jgi:hypothetical protein